MMTDSSHRKRTWKWIIGILAGLFALLAVALAGGAWWVWGWKLGELRFHESWSPEQRAELQTLSEEMKNFSRDVAKSNLIATVHEHYETLQQRAEELVTELNEHQGQKNSVRFTIQYQKSPRIHTFMHSLILDATSRQIMAPAHTALRKLSATGRGDKHAQASVAQIACRMGHLELAAEIIRRGENPNAGFEYDDHKENAFQSVINCDHFLRWDQQPSVEERLRLLDVMLKHGADINQRNTYWPEAAGNDENANLSFALRASATMISDGDKGAIMKWLIDHGLQLMSEHDTSRVAAIIRHPGTLPVIQHLIRKGSLPNTPDIKATLLCEAVTCRADDAIEKVLWCLEELGADPNLQRENKKYDEDDKGEILITFLTQSSAIDTFLNELPFIFNPPDENDKKSFEITLRILDILMEHGARPGKKEYYIALPKEESMRTRLMQALEKYHISYPSYYE